jgi:hypothetical protein
VHAKEFIVNFTVTPGAYAVRLKFSETRNIAAAQRTMTIRINGQAVATDFDIAAAAAGSGVPGASEKNPVAACAGLNMAVDLVFNRIQPRNGVIEVRFNAGKDAEAICQAIEVAPAPASDTQP